MTVKPVEGEVLTPIADLMARDPLKLSDRDVEQLVHQLRSQRANFLQGDKKIGTPTARKSTAQIEREKTSAIVGKLDLGDLGIIL